MELIGNMRYHYFTTVTKMDWKCKYKSKRKKKFPAESKWRNFFYLPFLRGFTWQKYIILSSFPVCLKCKSLQKRNKPLASFPEPGISFSQFFFFFTLSCGIQLVPTAEEARSLNPWITSGVQEYLSQGPEI